MNLLLDCSPLLAGGGVQVGLSLIHHAVNESGVRVHIIATKQFAAQIAADDKRLISSIFIVSKSGVMKKLLLQRRLWKIERQIKPDLVFTIFGPSYWRPRTVSLQGFALGKMLYPSSRSTYKSSLVRRKEEATDFLKKLLFKKNADYFVVETEVVKARLSSVLKIPADKIFVVGNSYSPAFEKTCNSVADKNALVSPVFTVFVPASFYHHKNLEIIPAVAGELTRRTSKDVCFVFTIPPESQGWKKIWNNASKLGVENLFKTVGAVPNSEVAGYYLRSNAVLCPSLIESSTAVFPEAFMSQRPLLVSDLDFARQLCGNAALFFDPNDPVSIASKILELVDCEKLREDLVEKGRRQLFESYPSPSNKWVQQLAVMKEIVQTNMHN